MSAKLQQSERVVRAELTYSDTYRFRVWQAAVHDATHLDMGFRSYHAHIVRRLGFWRKQGVELLSARDEPLNLSALSEDDLYGFLGKKDEAPFGPKRKIHATKLSVIDVYLKMNFPKLSESFPKGDISVEMVAIIRMFFSSDKDFLRRWVWDLNQLDAIYLKPVDYRALKGAPELSLDPFVVKLLIIRHQKESDFVIVHKISLPLKAEYLASSHLDIEVRRNIEKYSSDDTIIYSGIGIPSGKSRGTKLSVNCILRDRTTLEPHVLTVGIDTTFGMDRDENHFHYPEILTMLYSPVNNEASYIPLFSRRGFLDYAFSLGYTERLYNKAEEVYNMLGVGI